MRRLRSGGLPHVLPLPALLAGSLALSAALANAGPPAAARVRPVNLATATYDVVDLAGSVATWRGAAGLPDPRADGADAVADVILRTVRPEGWRPGRDGGSTLEVLDGRKLRIRATPRQHAAIRDLLAAL